jgi:hypothetical protein
MSLLERIIALIIAVLVVSALVLLMRHDIGRNAVAPKPPGAAAAGRFWWQ